MEPDYAGTRQRLADAAEKRKCQGRHPRLLNSPPDLTAVPDLEWHTLSHSRILGETLKDRFKPHNNEELEYMEWLSLKTSSQIVKGLTAGDIGSRCGELGWVLINRW